MNAKFIKHLHLRKSCKKDVRKAVNALRIEKKTQRKTLQSSQAYKVFYLI